VYILGPRTNPTTEFHHGSESEEGEEEGNKEEGRQKEVSLRK
jgi:hypothetical protein